MSNENLRALELTEQKEMGKAILLLINQYPKLRSFIGTNTASFNFLDKEKGISVFTSTGAVYLKENIWGEYEAQFPFEIAVKKPTNSDKERLALSDFLEALTVYVTSNKDAIRLDDGRTVESLEQTGVVSFVGRDAVSDIYRVGLRLIYKKE